MTPTIQILLMTILFGISCIIICNRLHRNYITSSTFYWFAWTLLFVCGAISEYYGWIIDAATDETIQLVSKLHVSAFGGFILGSLVMKRRNANLLLRSQKDNDTIEFIDKYKYYFLFIPFAIGILLFSDRWLTIGAEGLGDFYFFTRKNLEAGQASLWGWLGGHITATIFPFVYTVLGMAHSKQKLSLKILMSLVLANAPYSMALGFRLFLIIPIIQYLLSLIAYRSYLGIRLLSYSEIKTISTLLLSALFFFAVLGNVRSDTYVAGRSNTAIDFIRIPVSYVGSTVGAIAPVTKFVESYIEPVMGYNIGGDFIYMALQRTGISDIRTHKLQTNKDILEQQRLSGSWFLWVPPTTIPFFIADVGFKGMGVYAFLVFCILQMITLIDQSTIIRHMLVYYCVGIALDSTSIAAGFRTPMIVALIFTLILVKFVTAFREIKRGDAADIDHDQRLERSI